MCVCGWPASLYVLISFYSVLDLDAKNCIFNLIQIQLVFVKF